MSLPIALFCAFVHETASIVTSVNISTNIEFITIDVFNEISERKRNTADSMLIGTCAIENLSRSKRVVGGNKTDIKMLPYMAQLSIPTNKTGIINKCGGSIINNRFILTALHCVKNITDDKVNSIRISVGSNEFETGNIYFAQKIFLPLTVKIYNKTIKQFEELNLKSNRHLLTNAPIYMNDLAIIQTKKTIKYKATTVENIKFCDTYIDGGRQVQIGGWGRTPLSNSALYTTTSLTMSSKECAKALNGVIFDEQFKLCTYKNGTGACFGDSGGPLTVNGMQIGIVANSYNGCEQKFPDVFSRTSDYNQWIEYISENC